MFWINNLTCICFVALVGVNNWSGKKLCGSIVLWRAKKTRVQWHACLRELVDAPGAVVRPQRVLERAHVPGELKVNREPTDPNNSMKDKQRQQDQKDRRCRCGARHHSPC